jgi:prolyl oligopeptidase
VLSWLIAALVGLSAAQSDPFRWLENGKDPRIRRWARQHGEAARKKLDELPSRPALRARVEELLRLKRVRSAARRGTKSFYLKRGGLDNQAVLYVREKDGEPRVVVDPNAWGAEGDTGIDWFYPSHDGLLVAYGVSEAGSEKSVLRVREVDSALDLPDRIERTGQASVAWLPDRTGFYYTRSARPGGVPSGEEAAHRRVYFHRLGTDPLRDPLVFGEGRPKDEVPRVEVSRDGKWMIVTAYRGAASEVYAKELAKSTTIFTPIVQGAESLFESRVEGDFLYLLTDEGAPNGKILVVDLDYPARRNWKTLIPEGPAPIAGFEIAAGHLALRLLERTYSRVRIHDLKGLAVKEVPLPLSGTVTALAAHPGTDELTLVFESFLAPPAGLAYDVSRASLTVVESSAAPETLDDLVVKQVSYPSWDGKPVPMFLLHHKRLRRNKTNAALILARGVDEPAWPAYSASLIAWLERGGLVAQPVVRGGPELGGEWRKAGMREGKPGAVEDLVFAARWLVAQEYTVPQKLGIVGRGHGGLLAAATAVRAPDDVKAAALDSPIADLLRFPLAGHGLYWTAEYGSPADPADAERLWSYSPYHRVKKGGRYPSLLVTAGDDDSKIDASHARKLAAAWEWAGSPVLFVPETGGGEGPRRPTGFAIEEWADRFAFMTSELGLIDRDP